LGKRGKTPVLTADQARSLIDSIDTSTLIGLRDRALIGVMVYSFARISAAITMRNEDYFQSGKRWWLRLHEKGGKRHDVTDMAARSYGAATGRCLFLQWSLPSLQWPEMRAAS
jgi:integrase